MITLTETEQLFVKLCKGHLYKNSKRTVEEKMLTLFIKQYGYNPKEGNNYRMYKRTLYSLLMGITWKIVESENLYRIVDSVIGVTFEETLLIKDPQPIDRAITQLYYCIRYVQYLDDEGQPRFQLDKS